MSSGVLDLGFAASKQKREYSKGGCRECKRRKIKCDEGKPQCWQCARLHKECSYPEAGERVARVSKRVLQESPDDSKKKRDTRVSMPAANGSAINGDHPDHQGHQGHHSHQSHQSHQTYRGGSPGVPPGPPNGALAPPHGPVGPPVGPVGAPFGYPPPPYHYPVPYSRSPDSSGPPISMAPPLDYSPHPYAFHHRASSAGVVPPPQLKHEGSLDYPRKTSSVGVASPNGPSLQHNRNYQSNQSFHNQQNHLNFNPGYHVQGPPGPGKFSSSSIVSLLNDVSTPNPVDYHTSQSPNSVQTTISNTSNQVRTTPIVHQFQEPEDPDMLQFFDEDDLNLLATDLNNIVNNIMFESNFNDKYSTQFEAETEQSLKSVDTDDSRHPSVPHHSSSGSSHGPGAPSRPVLLSAPSVNPPHPESTIISPPQTVNVSESYPGRNLPMDNIKLKKAHEKRYLQEFCEDFVNIVLPFASYDKAHKHYFNPARDIILSCASQESFLLAAVLAHGAKTAFQKLSKPEDEEAYCTYLSKCLKLLGPALSAGGRSKNQKNGTSKDHRANGLSSDLTSNIEAVLVTVLLLTSANAANPKQDWRPHLRGAKDILLKVSTFKIKSSRVLIFCKVWFGILEILAGISSTLGGTLKSEAEMDLLVTSGDEHEINVLKEIGIIVDGDFNIMGGYHNDTINYLRDLIKILARIRNNKSFQPENEFEYFRLLSEFYRLSQLEFIDRRCVMDPSGFKDGVPDADLIDVIKPGKGREDQPVVIMSWMDTCHQAYVLASMITILIKCFKEKHDSPQVQMLSNKLISRMSFLKFYDDTEIPDQLIKCSMMMIQWPMLVAAMNCTSEDSMFLLRRFFKVSGQVGSASSKFALARLEKIWSLRQKGELVDSDFEDDYNDVLSY